MQPTKQLLLPQGNPWQYCHAWRQEQDKQTSVSSSPRALHGSSAQVRLHSMQQHYVPAARQLHS
jgi:hypothetical protein